MDYIKEINAFYDLLLSNPLSSGQVALWSALMHICNKASWPEWFSVANQTLEVLTGLSRKGVFAARNKLIQGGYISVKTRGTKTTMYRIHSLTTLKSTQDSTQATPAMSYFTQDSTQDSTRVISTIAKSTQTCTQDSTQDSTQNSATLNKLNDTKRNETKKSDVIHNPPHTPPREGWGGLEGAIHRFVEHRKAMKKPMTEHAVKLLRDRLVQLAPDEETQIAIIDQAIMCGWQSVYPLKDVGMQAQAKPNPSAQNYQQRSYKNGDLDHIFVDLDNLGLEAK